MNRHVLCDSSSTRQLPEQSIRVSIQENLRQESTEHLCKTRNMACICMLHSCDKIFKLKLSVHALPNLHIFG